MPEYTTQRKKIAEALANKLKQIDGNHPYNTNVFDNVTSKMLFLDEPWNKIIKKGNLYMP